MQIKRNKTVYTLTVSELRNAYDEYQQLMRLQDAAKQLGDYFGIDYDCDDAESEPGAYQFFEDTMGFSFDEAINNSSEHYVLDTLVRMYESKLEANVAENDTWQNVIDNYVHGVDVPN